MFSFSFGFFDIINLVWTRQIQRANSYMCICGERLRKYSVHDPLNIHCTVAWMFVEYAFFVFAWARPDSGRLAGQTVRTCRHARFATQQTLSALWHSRHVYVVTQQTCLLCQSADMSAVLQGRHVWCGKKQTCLMFHTVDMSAASHSRIILESNYFLQRSASTQELIT